MPTPLRLLLLLIAAALAPAAARAADAPPPAHPRPTMAEFMGLNVHTVQFKPDLYAPVCRNLRDYHPVGWDNAEDPSRATTFPMAANKVDWGRMYGSWVKGGFDINACLIFDTMDPKKWKDPAKDAKAYGQAFASYFGPSSKTALVNSIEIGNEPSKYSEATYRTLFEAMAQGARAGDPKLKIATCAVMTGKPDQWSKPMSAIAGLEPLFDIINIHAYAFKDKWPTWRRSHPEDPSINWLKSVEDVIQWRNKNAPGKEIWMTEFGYDASTKTPDPKSQWKQWVGVTDEDQARFIVRSFLVLSATDLERAYLYFFNDKDEAQLHAASGITRNFKPKPSFYAMGHLYKTLGDYRLSRVVDRKEGDLYCFEYQNAKKPAERVYVAWSPTFDGKSARRVLPIGPGGGGVYQGQRMALAEGDAAKVEWKVVPEGLEIEVSGAPIYLWTH